MRGKKRDISFKPQNNRSSFFGFYSKTDFSRPRRQVRKYASSPAAFCLQCEDGPAFIHAGFRVRIKIDLTAAAAMGGTDHGDYPTLFIDFFETGRFQKSGNQSTKRPFPSLASRAPFCIPFSRFSFAKIYPSRQRRRGSARFRSSVRGPQESRAGWGRG
jgi:hypothetical protein